MTATTCIGAPRRTLSEAIVERLSDYADPDSHEECTLGDLLDLESEFQESAWSAVMALVMARRVFVAVPLALLDWDAVVAPVTWEVGQSRAPDIERIFREPHAATETSEGRVLTYDLYVEHVEEGYPLPPAPYHVRDAADEDRPEGCNFPFTALWPPEALQIEFEFDAAGLLKRYDFKVGKRLT